MGREANYTGEDVKRIRRALGVSQAQMAQLLGVSTATVSRMEAGEQEVPQRVAVQLQILEKALEADPGLARRALVLGNGESLARLFSGIRGALPVAGLVSLGIVGLMALALWKLNEQKEEDKDEPGDDEGDGQ